MWGLLWNLNRRSQEMDGRNSDGSGIGWRRSTGHNNDDDEDEDDLNCGTDDVFSSFLNSLINEDVFTGHRHLQQQQHHGGVGHGLLNILESKGREKNGEGEE